MGAVIGALTAKFALPKATLNKSQMHRFVTLLLQKRSKSLTPSRRAAKLSSFVIQSCSIRKLTGNN
jgi:hypothetical protein